MKCRTCGERAVINMRQHKLGLCKEHFLEWLPSQTDRFIKKYEMFTRYEKVLVAVSGGKDSISLWDILINLGYQADGLHIDLGIDDLDGYSKKSRSICEEFASSRNQKLIVFDIQNDDTSELFSEWPASFSATLRPVKSVERFRPGGSSYAPGELILLPM